MVSTDTSGHTDLRAQYRPIITEAYQLALIDKDLFECLEVKWPIMPTCYALLKVHKNLQNPPGRPIVSGIGHHTEKASTYVDSQLRPHVIGLPSYLKDTLKLFKVIEGFTIPLGAILVAIDIKALLGVYRGGCRLLETYPLMSFF